jgi:hypothetical protein
LARKPNYDFEKRRKEQDRKAKKDAKRAERQRRDREPAPDEQSSDGAAAPDPGATAAE